MKKIVSVQEVQGGGFIALLGEKVILFCMNHIYAGAMVGVNTDCVLLETWMYFPKDSGVWTWSWTGSLVGLRSLSGLQHG